MGFRFTETQYPGNDNGHGGDDWFEFGPGGILGVHFADPKRDSKYFAPNAWVDLYTDQPPGPPTEAERVWGFHH